MSLLITASSFGQASVSEQCTIRLKKIDDSLSYTFKNGNYILSFRIHDISQIENDLDLTFSLSQKDTIDFNGFIATIDSTGKGNLTNNFRLNESFRKLFDAGQVKIYCISRNQELKRLEKKIDNDIPSAGIIYYYLDRNESVLEFREAFVGTPGF